MSKKVFLKKNEEERVLGGHAWVFSNEIREIQGSPAAGDTVETLDNLGRFVGLGFFNPSSLIAVRIFERKDKVAPLDIWVKKIRKALEYRARVLPGADSFRAVYGESDGIPGLVVDKFGKCLSAQMLSAGIEKNRDAILDALKEVFNPECIVLRNDSALRNLEGLPLSVEVVFGSLPEKVVVTENGLSFYADPKTGQKTGFYFDQRENRGLFAASAKGKKVLDCFCQSGSFGIFAKESGAASVVFVDSSKPALELAEQNYELNNCEGEFNGIVADAEEYLSAPKTREEHFDYINIDPPGLIKSRKDLAAGFRKYVKINSLALGLLKEGGMMMTSSCSHHLSPADFRKMIAESAAKAKKIVRISRFGSQGIDHPILASMPETEYLKCALVEVI